MNDWKVSTVSLHAYFVNLESNDLELSGNVNDVQLRRSVEVFLDQPDQLKNFEFSGMTQEFLNLSARVILNYFDRLNETHDKIIRKYH